MTFRLQKSEHQQMKLEYLVTKAAIALGAVMSEKEASRFGLDELAVKSSKIIDELVWQNATLRSAVDSFKEFEQERERFNLLLTLAMELLSDAAPSLLAPNNWDETRQTLVNQIKLTLQ